MHRNIYQRGVLLIDIMLALALTTVFVVIISDSSFGLRSAFNRAFLRSVQISDITSSTTPIVVERPFGNDFVEQDIGSISLMKVRPNNDINISTPLCSVDFSFHNSISITPIALPIDPRLPMTDLIVRNGVVYISIDSTTASDPDIFVFDIKDRSHATLLTSINTGPGIRAITLAKNILYAAAASTASQLHIMRLNSQNSVVLEKKYQLPLPFATATPAWGSSIFFDDNYIYLGSEKNDSDEISIIDVFRPNLPIKISGLETGSKVNDLFVRGNILYVADSSQAQLRTIDISDISHPILITDFGPSGWSRQEGKVFSYFEDSLRFGRAGGGFDITTDHELFNFSSTTISMSPFTHSLSYLSSINIPGGVYGIVEDRSHVYIVTREPDREFQIFDRFTLSTTTGSIYSPVATYSLPVAPQKLTCDSEHLYVLAGTAPVIYEISFK